MARRKNQPKDHIDEFIKNAIPLMVKTLCKGTAPVAVKTKEDLEIDIVLTVIKDRQLRVNDSLGLLGRLVTVHPTTIIEHYSGYLDAEDIDSCILRSGLYWELNKDTTDKSDNIRLTKDSAMNPNPLHPDRPFTWILAVDCGKNLLKRWQAVEDPDFGTGVYRLATPGLTMGIVHIEALPYNRETMTLKLLGNADSAQTAFSDVIKLDPNLELRNDIIETSVEHCVYLQKFKEELTEEDRKFMAITSKTQEAVKEWVDARHKEAKLEMASRQIGRKYGVDILTTQISRKLDRLTEQQLDEFAVKIFDWQDSNEMEAWLQNSIEDDRSRLNL